MTLTGHFLDGLDMLKLFRTARFLFGMLAVLSLLLLPSLSPYRTMASSSFLDPTSAERQMMTMAAAVPHLAMPTRQMMTMAAAVPHLAMPTRQMMTMAAAVPHLAMPMSPPLAPHPPPPHPHHHPPTALAPNRPRFRITTA